MKNFLNRKHFVLSLLLAVILMPMIASAAGLQGLLTTVSDLLTSIIPILILGAVVWFIIGIIKYVVANTGEEKEKGVHVIISGIIGLTVIVSMWALVGFLRSTLGVGTGSNTIPSYQIPCVPGNGHIC